MTAATFRPYLATYADYLAVEGCSEAKHDFVDGVIVAMAGASDEHNAIASQILALLHGRTRPGCRAYNPDQKFWIESSGNARYSDVSIICGPAQHPAHDPQATANPLVLVEVLSPSTQRNDHSSKRDDFQSMPTLEAYVLVAQDRRWVAVYRRQDSPNRYWSCLQYLHGDDIELPGLVVPITVDEIYRGILDAEGRTLLREAQGRP